MTRLLYITFQRIKFTKIIIGGAPVTQEFADDIGADGYSDDASTAVNLRDLMMSSRCPEELMRKFIKTEGDNNHADKL